MAAAAKHIAGYIGIVGAGLVQPEKCTVTSIGTVCRSSAVCDPVFWQDLFILPVAIVQVK